MHIFFGAASEYFRVLVAYGLISSLAIAMVNRSRPWKERERERRERVKNREWEKIETERTRKIKKRRERK